MWNPHELVCIRDVCSLTKYLEKKAIKINTFVETWTSTNKLGQSFQQKECFQAAHLRLANLWEMRRWVRQCIFWRFKLACLFALFIRDFCHVITQALLVQSRQEKPAWFRPDTKTLRSARGSVRAQCHPRWCRLAAIVRITGLSMY